MRRKILLTTGIAALISLSACNAPKNPEDSNQATATDQSIALPAGITKVASVTKADGEIVIPFNKYVLDNGLTVVLHPDDSDPLVHVDITYHVGSGREEVGKSGFAHFFEHMMFQGSENVADEQHFGLITESGGTLNGSTNSDRTNYYETVPSNQLERMLWLEADRMGFFLDAVTEEKFDEVKADSLNATKSEGSVLNLLKSLFSKKMRFVLLVALVVAVCQQATGVNAIYFYAPSIFEQSGVGQNAAFSQAIWVGVINVVFTVVAMLLIDKLGRKPLMLIGLAGVFLSMSVVAYGFHNATYQLTEESVQTIESPEHRAKLLPILGKTYNDDISFKQATIELLGEADARQHQSALIQSAVTINSLLVLIGILSFVAAFAVSLGPVMWVLLAEILPNRLRGIGIACIGAVNSFVSFSVQLLFPWELANLGTAMTFMIYGLLAVIGFVLIYKMLPETKGRSLEEIEDIFDVRQTSA